MAFNNIMNCTIQSFAQNLCSVSIRSFPRLTPYPHSRIWHHEYCYIWRYRSIEEQQAKFLLSYHAHSCQINYLKYTSVISLFITFCGSLLPAKQNPTLQPALHASPTVPDYFSKTLSTFSLLLTHRTLQSKRTKSFFLCKGDRTQLFQSLCLFPIIPSVQTSLFDFDQV